MKTSDISMTEEDKKKLSDYIVINETTKRLDKEKKKLAEEVKDIFIKYNIIDSIDHDGSTFTVTESVRKTVDKNNKDNFILELLNIGKNYLVMTSVDIDTDTLYSEYRNGLIDKSLVEKYVKISSVKTLTVK